MLTYPDGCSSVHEYTSETYQYTVFCIRICSQKAFTDNLGHYYHHQLLCKNHTGARDTKVLQILIEDLVGLPPAERTSKGGRGLLREEADE